MRTKEKHGMCDSGEYRSWCGARDRCTNPNYEGFHLYGGRGIKMCDRWINSFVNFYTDMGPKPSPQHQLDRFPNQDGNYEPSNCRWATAKDQARNTRQNILLEYQGKTMCMAEWAELYGLKKGTLWFRIAVCKWPMEKALTRGMHTRK